MNENKFKNNIITSFSSFIYPFPEDFIEYTKEMHKIIDKFWKLNRTPVNEDTDKLVKYIKENFGGKIITSQPGEDCLSWKIPLNWAVRKGILKKETGEILADYEENPMYLWTNSISFKGKIKKKDLLENHILTNKNNRNVISYHYKNGYKHNASEWGFSLPYKIVESMNDEFYFVDVETELNAKNTLKVVDLFLEGDTEDTIFFMAHTCHPAQVSDGLANIAIALQLYNILKEKRKRKYSYRFIFGPEYFAAATYLEKAKEEKIHNLKFGIYLDMLSNHEPLGFQNSMQSNALIDNILKNIFASHLPTYIQKPYRELWGNDEMFYNGPSYNIPTVGLGRCMHKEYHNSSDTPKNIDNYHLAEALWILKRITEIFESDYIPELKYKGPLYLSRYDFELEQGIVDNIEKIQTLADKNNSCMDIANILDVDFFKILKFFEELKKENLINKKERNLKKEDLGLL